MPKRPRRGAVEQPGACGGPDQRERLERDLHRARPGPAADHQVEAAVLERGVENLLDLGVEAVDLVHEQQLARLERREQGRQVAGALDDGTRRGLDRRLRARRRSRARGWSCRLPAARTAARGRALRRGRARLRSQPVGSRSRAPGRRTRRAGVGAATPRCRGRRRSGRPVTRRSFTRA